MRRALARTALLAALCAAPAAWAQIVVEDLGARPKGPPAIAPSSDPRDLNGIWFQKGYNGSFDPIEGGAPHFTPQGLAEYQKRQAASAAGRPLPDPPTQCWPHGVPRIMLTPAPFQFFQTPDQLTIVAEQNHNVRRIFLDKPHPPTLTPTLMGHSVGRWEGDTLVVDTVGLDPRAWIDEDGKPESDRLHVVEHLRKIDGGQRLEDLITIDDPKVFTEPYTARRVYEWRPDARPIEYICEENLRDQPDIARLPPDQRAEPVR